MITVLTNPALVITVNTDGKKIKRGKEMSDISPLSDHHIIIENGLIKDFIPFSSFAGFHYDELIDVSGKTVVPGFVECHTHSVFSGSRSDEFTEKLKGISYEEIAKRGGGINKTVESVRNFSFEKLSALAGKRINFFIEQGVTTLEIKSGYGLDFNNEIKILRVIKYLNSIYPIDIIPTFLGAHVLPSEFKHSRNTYLDLINNKLLPYIARNNLARFCDAFCESSAFEPEEIGKIFTKAERLGLSLKLHSDQFNSIGGIDTAVKFNVASLDHLEAIKKEDIKKVVSTDSICVLLPGVSYFLNYEYAPARDLINENASVALATDYNPGSSNIRNIFFIMNLAALKLGMSVEEIISAYTINSAAALKLNGETGSLEINKKADLSVLNTDNYNDIIYEVGQNLNYMTIKNGEIIFRSV